MLTRLALTALTVTALLAGGLALEGDLLPVPASSPGTAVVVADPGAGGGVLQGTPKCC